VLGDTGSRTHADAVGVTPVAERFLVPDAGDPM